MTGGKCSFCQGIFAKEEMTGHLKSCAKRADAGMASPPKPPAKAQLESLYLVLVEGTYLPEYWMLVEVPGKATLADLDSFLRRTWLECCGHCSAFTIAGKRYKAMADGGESMDTEVEKVLAPRKRFYHEYDFGSTTELTLKVLSVRQGLVGKKQVLMLARNEPPHIPCGVCKKPATQVCNWCGGTEESWLCDECARHHDCGEEGLLPVVNSPRVGVCGYTG